MKFFSIFIILTTWSSLSYGQLEPWYKINDIEKLEINVLFDEGSLTVKSYYDFHIKQFSRIIKSNPSLGIVVVHGESSSLSRYRARRIHDFLVQRYSVTSKQIHVTAGLPRVYSVPKGEKVVLHIRKNFQAKFKSKKRLPAAFIKKPNLVQTSKKKPEYIFINKTPKKKTTALELNVGVREYTFSNTDKGVFALAVDVKAKKRISSFLNLTLDGGSSFSDLNFASKSEYNVALGLESESDYFNLNTKVYGRKNWAWVESDSEFVTVNDLGLHLGLDFKLVRRPSYAVTLGVWAELSLSNTVSEFASSNVLSFQTEITFEWFDLKTFITLFRQTRKYEVFEANVLGLNLGYKF